jgi:hypothetical protein
LVLGITRIGQRFTAPHAFNIAVPTIILNLQSELMEQTGYPIV